MFTSEFFDDLVDKYSLPVDTVEFDQLTLNQKLEELRNFLKNEIYKQYKLQEGAEKMRCASTDKKLLSNLNAMIKESNAKIDELNQELLDLNSYIVISQSESNVVLDSLASSTSTSSHNHFQQHQYQHQQQHHNESGVSPERHSLASTNGSGSGRPSGECSQDVHAYHYNSNNGNGNGHNGHNGNHHHHPSAGNGHLTNDSTDTITNSSSASGSHTDVSTMAASTTASNDPRVLAHEQRVRVLNRQLEIETKIKAGAENMLQSFSQGLKRDKKLHEDAQAMLKDAKLKIEYIKMQLNKVNNQFNESMSSTMYGQHRSLNDGATFLSNKLELSMPVELRLEELRHRLHIESAVCEGAKNAVNIIQSQKNDKKALQQAQSKLNESLQRISLLNLSWQHILKGMASRNGNANGNSFDRTPLQQQPPMFANGEMPRAAPITGQLEVRLMGCQDLLECVPDRQKRDTFTIPGSLDKTPKALKASGVMGASKTYTLRGNDLSSKPSNIYILLVSLLRRRCCC